MKMLITFLLFLCVQADAYQVQIRVYDTIRKIAHEYHLIS